MVVGSEDAGQTGKGVRTSVLLPSDPRWLAALACVDHDIYHLPGYAGLEAERLGGDPFAILIEEGKDFMFLPLVIRALPRELNLRGIRDAVSPYGYPGPLVEVSPTTPPGFGMRAAQALVTQLDALNVCSVFVRLHPLLKFSPELSQGVGTFREHGQTAWIDLSLAADELWAQTGKTTRNLINRTRRSGYVARIDGSWLRFSDFVTLYEMTMQRVGASRSYFFGEGYLQGLRLALADRLHLCVVELDGVVKAAGLFTECCGIVQYHLSGAVAQDGSVSPNRLMLDYVRTWAKERGARAFHLGGGFGAKADSLMRFKSTFSRLRSRFCSWEIAVNEGHFRAATEAWESGHGQRAENGAGFFPPYRR